MTTPAHSGFRSCMYITRACIYHVRGRRLVGRIPLSRSHGGFVDQSTSSTAEGQIRIGANRYSSYINGGRVGSGSVSTRVWSWPVRDNGLQAGRDGMAVHQTHQAGVVMAHRLS